MDFAQVTGRVHTDVVAECTCVQEEQRELILVLVLDPRSVVVVCGVEDVLFVEAVEDSVVEMLVRSVGGGARFTEVFHRRGMLVSELYISNGEQRRLEKSSFVLWGSRLCSFLGTPSGMVW